MKVLLTGGLGHVGSALASELRGRGHEVWLIDLFHSEERNYVRCDISKFRQLERLFEEHVFDYVYHLAAEFGRWNGEDYYENLWLTNAVGTKNMIRLQEKMRFRMIIFSSSEVYGDYEGLMREDVMDTVPVKQMNDYAMTNWVNEMQVLNSAAMFGTETVRARLFNTYGPREFYSKYRSAICMFIYHALKDWPYTVYLRHKRTSTYVDDTTRTLGEVINNFKPGEVYNIGGIQEHDMKYVSDLILNFLGKDDSKVEYKEAEPFTTGVKKIDCSKAMKDLHHNPQVLLEQGIPRTIEWMRKAYNL